MYAQEFSVDYSIDENYLPDEAGCDVAAAFSNAGAQISLNGFTSTGAAISTTLGGALVVANTFAPNLFITGVTDSNDGETITTSVKNSLKSRDFESVDLTGVFKPFMGALVV